MTNPNKDLIRRGDALKAALDAMNLHRGESDIDFGAYAACGDVHQAIAALPAVQPAPVDPKVAALVDALLCVRDYVEDASRGQVIYTGKYDITKMATEDLARINAALAA
jgi:hypothetical protein